MNFLFATSLLFCLFVGVCRVRGAEVETAKVYTTSNSYFEIVSEDPIAAQYLNTASRRLTEMLRRYLDVPDAYPQLMLVQLIPAERWSYRGAFQTVIKTGGNVSLNIHWDVETQEQLTFRALVQAFLVRWKVWHLGPQQATRVPLWLELALTEEFKTQLNPVYIDYLAENAMRLPPPNLNTILKPIHPESEVAILASHAYWLLQYLEAESSSPENLRNLLSSLASHKAPRNVVAQAMTDRALNPGNLELWWAVGYYDLIQRRRGPYYGLSYSQKMVENLSIFTLAQGGIDVRVTLPEMREARDNPDLESLVNERRLALKRKLPFVNPVYYNALLSLGQVLEAFFKDEANPFYYAYLVYERELAAANILAGDITGLLQAAPD